MYVRVQRLVSLLIPFVVSLVNITTYFWVLQNIPWIESRCYFRLINSFFQRQECCQSRLKSSTFASHSSSFPVLCKYYWCKITLIHFCYSGVVVVFFFIYVQGTTLLQSLFWVSSSVWFENPYVKECFLVTHPESASTNGSSCLIIRLSCFSPFTLRKKWSFPLRISSVNVKIPSWKTSFFVQC